MRRHVVVLALIFGIACGRQEVTSGGPTATSTDGAPELSGQQRFKVIDLFRRLRMEPKWSSETPRDSRSVVRIGRLLGDPTSEVMVVQVGEAIEGTVLRGSCPQKCASFERVDDQIELVPFDPRKFITDGIPLDPRARRARTRNSSAMYEREEEDLEPLTVQTPCSSEMAAPITALILYTDKAKEAAGSDDAIRARIYYAEASTNEIFKVGGLPVRLQILDIQAFPFEETGSLKPDLRRLTDNPRAIDARKAVGADVTFLIVSRGDDIGLSHLLHQRGMTFAANADSAFGLVRVDGLKCGWSLTHELGHLLGACHDRRGDEKPGHCRPDSTERHFGHRNNIAGRKWATVMARPTEVIRRIPRWSTPRQKCGADDLGTDTNDNLSWLKGTAPRVAQFRCTAAK